MPKSTSLWLDTVATFATEPLDARRHPRTSASSAPASPGLTTAYLLAREGRSVVVIDAGRVGGGRDRGDDRAPLLGHRRHLQGDAAPARTRRRRLAYESHARAIDRIEAICDEEHIDCRFERVRRLPLPRPRTARTSMLDEELEAARAAGAKAYAHARRRRRAGIRERSVPAVRRPGAVPSAQVPVRPRGGVRSAAADRSTRTRGRSRRPAARRRTSRRHRATPSAPAPIVVATNSPFNDLVAIHTKQAPYHTYAIGARVAAGAITHGALLGHRDPYHYVRAAARRPTASWAATTTTRSTS